MHPVDRAGDTQIAVALGMAVGAQRDRSDCVVALETTAPSGRPRLPLQASLPVALIYNCSIRVCYELQKGSWEPP